MQETPAHSAICIKIRNSASVRWSRSDANGSFVLVVVAKSSPLGNRYVATRADIQVLASDDTTSAVSGLANGDFVITTSTEPIEAGKQVRLVDNG